MTRRVEVAPEEWECVRRLSDETPDDRVEVGPKEDLLAPLDVINMVSQVRQEYDPHDLAELKRAMIVEDEKGEKKIQLIQPITVGYFHRTDLGHYLEKLNSTWGTEHSVSELNPVPGSHGRYFFVVVAGHRRTIAIRQAAEELGIDPSRIDVVFHVNRGTDFTFREGIKTQYRENFHKRPESWEDAVAINAIFGEGLRSGEYSTYADCAKDLGVNPERVSRAYRFSELPEAIQNMVEKKVLSYGAAAAVHTLAVALAFRYGKHHYSAVELQQFVQQYESGKVLLRDLTDSLTDREKEKWERELFFTHVSSKEVRGKTVPELEKHVKKQAQELIYTDEIQLTLVPMTEAEINRNAEQKQAATARRVLQNSIKDIVAVLEAERSRLSNNRPPVMGWSPSLLVRTNQVTELIAELAQGEYGESLDDLNEKVETGLVAARIVLAELTNQVAEQTDVFADAIQRTLDEQPSLLD